MKTPRAILLAAVCVLLSCGMAGPAVRAPASGPDGGEAEAGLVFRYYDVRSNGRDLLASVNHATPIREAGNLYHAYTRWKVEWRLRWQPGLFGQCRIGSAQVTLTGEVTLPRLVDGDPAEQRRFARYLAALRRHELTHYGNGRAAAAAVERKLASLAGAADCATLARTVDEAAAAVVDEYRQKDRDYDAVTEHGRREGASLET